MSQCYKNTAVNYRSNFNPTFSRVKMMQFVTVILSKIMLYNIGYTNTGAIYCHSMAITKVLLLYNTGIQYDLRMVVNYNGKKFYNIRPMWLFESLDEKHAYTEFSESLCFKPSTVQF